MITATLSSCGNNNIVSAGVAGNNTIAYYLNTNPSGFITLSDLDGKLITQTASLPSGDTLYRINFASLLIPAPGAIFTQLLNPINGSSSYTDIIRSIDISGFYIEFSNTLGSGYTLMANYISGSDFAGAFLSSGQGNGNPHDGVSSLNSLSGDITLVGINNTISTSGHTIFISGSPATISSTNVVFTTGDQTISGNKDFHDFVTIKHAVLGGLDVFNSNSLTLNDTLGVSSIEWGNRVANDNNGVNVIEWGNYSLIDSLQNQSLDWGARELRTGAGGNPSLNWGTKQLSGNWLTDTLPVVSGHLINKGYLDSITGQITSPNITNLVHTTGNETINGLKTFTEQVAIVHGHSGASIPQFILSGTGAAGGQYFGDVRFALMHSTLDTGWNGLGLFNNITFDDSLGYSLIDPSRPGSAFQMENNYNDGAGRRLNEFIWSSKDINNQQARVLYIISDGLDRRYASAQINAPFQITPQADSTVVEPTLLVRSYVNANHQDFTTFKILARHTGGGNAGAYLNFVCDGSGVENGDTKRADIGFGVGISNGAGWNGRNTLGIFSNILHSNPSGSGFKTRLFIDEFGQIGINTATPSYGLDVNQFINSSGYFITGQNITGLFYPYNLNPSGYITTGQTGLFADQNYVNNASGTLSSRLNSTGQTLISLISAASAGVSAINGQSGLLTLTGAGSVTVSFVGQAFTVSGASSVGGGNVTSVGSLSGVVGLTGINNITTSISGNTLIVSGVSTGSFITSSQTGQFYASSNPNNYIANSGFITTGQTGAFYPTSNPNNYIANTGFLTGFLNGPSGSSGIASGIINNKIQFLGLSGSTGILISSISGVGALVISTTGLVSNAQTGNFVTTGQTGLFADQTYVNNASGALSTRLQTTGSTLLGLIQAASAGVSAINGASGILTFTGAGNVTISSVGQAFTISGAASVGGGGNVTSVGTLTGIVGATGVNNITTSLSGNTIIISGINTGSFVTTSQTGNFITTSQTGAFITSGQTGQFYASTNPNNYISYASVGGVQTINITGSLISGAISLTGLGNVVLTKSGQNIYISGDTSLLATAANLASTGANLLSQVNTINSWTGITTGLYYPYASNPSGYLTSSVSRVSSLTATGAANSGIFTGDIKISGAGNIVVYTGALNSIIISGSGSASSTTASNIGAGSGIFSGTASNDLKFKTLIAGSGIQLSGDASNSSLSIILTGSAGGGTINNNTFINSGSGVFIFRSGINSGNEQQFIAFPSVLDSNPYVIASLHNNIDDNILSCQVSGATTSGFWALFSSTPTNTGYYLDVFASNSTATGLATIVVVQPTLGVYRNFWVDAGAMLPTSLSGATAGAVNYSGTDNLAADAFLFDDTIAEYINFKLMMPDEWNKTAIKVKLGWSPSSGNGNVVWEVAAASVGDLGTPGNLLGTAITIIDSGVNTGQFHLTTGSPLLTIGNSPSTGMMTYFRVGRLPANSSDTVSGDAKLLGLGIQYLESTSIPVSW